MYKAYYHSLVQCPGADDCANPLLCRPLLAPYTPDVNAYLALLQRTPNAERTALRFNPAWCARHAEIEVLADRAAKKRTAAMRIGVIHDTTAFKGTRIPRSGLSVAAEHGFDVRLRQVLLLQLARRGNLHLTTCLERVAALLMESRHPAASAP